MPVKKQLDFGTRDPEVKELQRFLNNQGFFLAPEGRPGSPGNETDYFGPATQRALQRFQAAHGIVSSGSPTTTGFGRVGPQTLSKINEVGYDPLTGLDVVKRTGPNLPQGDFPIESVAGIPVTREDFVAGGRFATQQGEAIDPSTGEVVPPQTGRFDPNNERVFRPDRPESEVQNEIVNKVRAFRGSNVPQSQIVNDLVSEYGADFQNFITSAVSSELGGIDTGGTSVPADSTPTDTGGTSVPIDSTPTDTSNVAGDSFLDDLIALNPFVQEQLQDPNLKARFDALPASLKPTYYQLLNQLGQAVESGQVVNPDIEITPDQVAEFTNQAVTELDPYYQEQIGLIKQDLNTSLSRLQEDYQKFVGRSEEPFEQTLQQQAEQEAQQGTAFSSGRQDRERRLVLGQQQQLDDAFQSIARSGEDVARQAERRIGSTALGNVDTPSIRRFTADVTGFTPGDRQQLLSPQSDILGSIAKDRETAVRQRASELEDVFRRNRILDLRNLS